MRLINLMTFVGALLLLAMIPAFLHLGQVVGAGQTASVATAAAIGMLALCALRQR